MSHIPSLQGAKNHGVVMPDANKENTINQLVGAAFGAAGQRCMALSTAIFVGESQEWLPELVERSKSLRVNAGTDVVIFFFFSPFCFFVFNAFELPVMRPYRRSARRRCGAPDLPGGQGSGGVSDPERRG